MPMRAVPYRPQPEPSVPRQDSREQTILYQRMTGRMKRRPKKAGVK